MRRAARWGTLAAALVVVASVSAHAADDRATREAEARFTEGLSAVKTRDYEAARLSFAQAYAVLHRPLILWNLALSEEKSGHLLDAVGHFRQVTRDMPGASEATGAQKHLDALMAQMGRVDLQAPAGTTFTLDGGDVAGSAPLADPLDVLPGHHVVEARLVHGGARTLQVDATAGQVAHLTFGSADPPAVAPAPVAPPVPAQPAPTEAQGSEAASPDRSSSRPVSTGKVVMTAALGGAAAVAVGLGAYFGLQSRSNANTAKGYRDANGGSACGGSMPPGYCAAWNNAIQAENRDATASDVLYIAGGVFAVSAVMTLLLWPRGDRPASAWVLPEVGPAGAGIGAGGRF
jgi:hypothetical protein